MALDNEDKEWLSELLRTGMQQLSTELRTERRGDLNQLRLDLRTELHTDMDQLRTEWRGDMNQLRTELSGDLNQFRLELRTELRADIERVETNLLTAFHKWASPTEARMRGVMSTLNALDLELNDLKDRVKKIEDSIRPSQ